MHMYVHAHVFLYIHAFYTNYISHTTTKYFHICQIMLSLIILDRSASVSRNKTHEMVKHLWFIGII